MNDDKVIKALDGILECLKKQETAKQQARQEYKINRRRDSFAQISSMYAVIAIFIATLSLGFLTYMHDTFVDRPEEIPAKATDSVVIFSLMFSVLLSISSSIALGVGASPTLFLSLPTKDSMHEVIYLLIASGVPRSLAYKLHKLYPNIMESSRYTAQRMPRSPRVASFETPGQGRRISLSHWDRVRSKFALQTKSIVDFWSAASKTRRLPSTESQFVIGMLLVALVCILGSLLSLAIAVITFAWAELGKTVALLATVSLVFPFAVLGCFVIIYRCTLYQCSRGRKASLDEEKQDASLEHADGENVV